MGPRRGHQRGESLGLAREGLHELPPFSRAPSRRISQGELALLEARRDLAVAQREHDRAVAVVR